MIRSATGARLRHVRFSPLLALALAAPGFAQTAPAITPPPVPLNDTNCDFYANQPVTVPPCTVDGTRTVTYNGRTRSVVNGTTDRLTDSYSVAFSGNLQVDGAPVIGGPGSFAFPYGPPNQSIAVDISGLLDTTGQIVNVNTNYNAVRSQSVPTGGAGTAAVPNPAYFGQVSNIATTVNSIAINLDGYFETADGQEYDYRLNSVNPTNIVNNGTALTGYFRTGDDSRSLQFGKLAGTATVNTATGYSYTPFDPDTGAVNTGAISLHTLGYAVTATVTTQLDENGLFTPKVAVTEGIEMNGSRITGLGAGTAATDAVNKGQLDARIAVGGGGGAGPVASGNFAVASGSGASATGDNAIALGSGAAAVQANTTAIGANAKAERNEALAIGSGAYAFDFNNIAVGTLAQATAFNSTAFGNRALASGTSSTAIGQSSIASGAAAVALGVEAAASGLRSTALGTVARAAGAQSLAVGTLSAAGGDNSTAIGDSAQATQARATAVGQGAQAVHAGATAIGQGAVSTAANQVVLGGSGTSVRLGDMAASTAAQQGPVKAVTVDNAGTLGVATVATAQSVSNVQASVQYIAAVTDAQFSSLDGRVSTLFDLREHDRKDFKQGIAAVAAQAAPHFPSEAGKTSYASNVAVFRGEFGVSAGVAHRFEGDFAITAGASYAGGKNTVVKAGVAGEF